MGVPVFPGPRVPDAKQLRRDCTQKVTQFMETVIEELFEPMDVSDSQFHRTLKRAYHNVAQRWTESLAPRRPDLAKEVCVSVQDVFVALNTIA